MNALGAAGVGGNIGKAASVASQVFTGAQSFFNVKEALDSDGDILQKINQILPALSSGIGLASGLAKSAGNAVGELFSGNDDAPDSLVQSSSGIRYNPDVILQKLAEKQDENFTTFTETNHISRANEAIFSKTDKFVSSDSTEDNKPVQFDATGRMIREKQSLDTIPVPERKPKIPNISNVKIPQYNSDPVFDQFRENLKPREGGKSSRSLAVDPGGDTNKGMSQEALDDIRKIHPKWNLPKKSFDLTDKQITDLFRDQYYEFTQVNKLNEVAGFDKTGSKLVEHVFDAGVMTNPTKVGAWLQESIDETIGTDLKVNKNSQKSYDGILGSQTRTAMKDVVDQGKTLEVSRKFLQKRIDYLKTLGNKSGNAGWWPRVNSFKE